MSPSAASSLDVSAQEASAHDASPHEASAEMPSPHEAALNDSSDQETSPHEASDQEASPHDASDQEAFPLTTSLQLAASKLREAFASGLTKLVRPEFGFGGVVRSEAAAFALISPTPTEPRAAFWRPLAVSISAPLT